MQEGCSVLLPRRAVLLLIMVIGVGLQPVMAWDGPVYHAVDVSLDPDSEFPEHHPWDMEDVIRSRKGRSLLDDALQRIQADKDINLPHGMLMQSPPAGAAAPAISPSTKTDVAEQCVGTLGDWCTGFYTQQGEAVEKLPPRGNKTCHRECHKVGVCNHDTGFCMCPAGFTGYDCTQIDKRPCTNRERNPEDPYGIPMSHIDPKTKEDIDWLENGWMASRCNGYCDDDVGMCYCGRDSRFRHIPPDPGQIKPKQKGRPMINPCQMGEDDKGNKMHWGSKKYNELYGPDGWCNVEKEAKGAKNPGCGCALDGVRGQFCDEYAEQYCPLQCSGHGECDQGFCRCHAGWYGTDCARKRAGMELEPSEILTSRKYLQSTIRLSGNSLDRMTRKLETGSAKKRQRRKPYIYIYDLPPEYNARMLQYRLAPTACVWREFSMHNDTNLMAGNTYAVETYLHEALLMSTHRTFDPEEADFFYIPAYVTCLMWPVLSWADHPWWHAPIARPRPMHAANMMLEIKHWIQRTYPWWDRRQGRDHIWLMAHDEGACYMPSEIYKTSIMLTHWGRTALDHTSYSGWPPDNYTEVRIWPGYQDKDWRHVYMDDPHPCHDPKKDLVIPAFKPVAHFSQSPLMGSMPYERDILAYFRGDVGLHREKWYSRRIRQTLYIKAQQENWREKHKIYIGTSANYPGNYGQHLARTKFCLVLPGDGWSPRAEDAILHGCVPVVINDGVESVFESALDWSKFGIRIREADMEQLPQILEAVSAEELKAKQVALTKVWHRFAYATSPTHRTALQHTYLQKNQGDLSTRWAQADHHFRPLQQYPVRNDALNTILQWLYGQLMKNATGAL